VSNVDESLRDAVLILQRDALADAIRPHAVPIPTPPRSAGALPADTDAGRGTIGRPIRRFPAPPT
jgi:hypothetical protein